MSKPANRFYLILQQSPSFATFDELEARVLGSDGADKSPLNPANFLVVEGVARPISTALRLGSPAGGDDAKPTREKPDDAEKVTIDASVLDVLMGATMPLTAREIAAGAPADFGDVSPALQRLKAAGKVVKVTGKTWAAVKPAPVADGGGAA